jgi:hypothetical protein
VPFRSPDDFALLQAFRDAEYRVTLPTGGEVTLRIDEVNLTFDAALLGAGGRTFGLVTAFNPGAGERPETANREAQRALEEHLRRAGHAFWPAHNQAKDGSFREPSCCVLGLSADEAAALGRLFGQVAVVWGEVGQPPRLVGCAPPLAE